MPIRPIDVRRKEFRSTFRGYDASQVDDFLDAVADEFERAYTENQRMREEVSSLRGRLEQFEELEGSIQSALVHAEQAADDVRRSASREADLMVREAKARAHQLLAESSARVERVQESYDALQEAKRNFTNDFRYLLKTYMDMMDNMEIASAKEIESSLRQRLDTEAISVAREAAAHEEQAAPAPEEDATEPFEPARAAPPPGPQPETQAETQPETQPPTPSEQHAPPPEAAPEEASGEISEEMSEEVTVVEETASAHSVEAEEPTLAQNRSSESFFEGVEGEGDTPSPGAEGPEDSRTLRASRFVRRKDSG